MNNETNIIQNDDGSYQLANGNAESVESWDRYEDAKSALIADNDLQTEADATDNPDLYNDNTQIEWIA